MNKFERYIYNLYLKVLRTEQNKPYRFREDFDGFEETVEYGYIKKICKIFNEFSFIKHIDFFQSPYRFYQDSGISIYDLHFYTTTKALKIYTLYQNQLDNSPPEKQIDRIVESLKFIKNFCQDNNISIDQYLDHKTELLNTFLTHLKERRINIYTLFGFGEQFSNTYYNIPEDIRIFMLENIEKNINMYRSRFFMSEKVQKIVLLGLKKVENIIKSK